MYSLFFWRRTHENDNPHYLSFFYRFAINVLSFAFNLDAEIDDEKLEYYKKEAQEWKLRYQASREQSEAQISALGKYVTWHARRFSEMDIRVATMASDINTLLSERATLIHQRTQLHTNLLQLQQIYNERIEEIRDLVQENDILDQQVDALSLALHSAGEIIHSLQAELRKTQEEKNDLVIAHASLRLDFRDLEEENVGLRALVNGDLTTTPIPTPNVTPLTSTDSSSSS